MLMLFESANNVAWSAIVLLLGASLCVVSARLIGMRPLTTALLYTWHTGWAIFYGSYVLANGGDAFSYFERARFDFVELSLGTQFIIWLTSFPAGLGLGYWPITFVYNTAGATGLVFFYAALRESSSGASHSRMAKILVLICTLLPSLSFWTSGIGKDSIAFLSVGMFVWAATAFGGRQLVATIAVLIMLPVRPHIAVLMVMSVGVGTLFVADLRATARFGMGAIATAAAVFVVPLALIYTGTARFSSISEFISDRQERNMGGGSSIDITGMNPVLRLFSYLYRPLPNEAAGFSQLAASLDNFMLILLTGIGIIAIVRGGFIRTFRTQSINLLYGLACLGLLSQVTANLGLAARQKWMLVPALMLVIIAAWSARKENAESDRAKFRRLSGAPQAVR
jgi:hypothetical protein